jgi:hypothetical protein
MSINPKLIFNDFEGSNELGNEATSISVVVIFGAVWLKIIPIQMTFKS